ASRTGFTRATFPCGTACTCAAPAGAGAARWSRLDQSTTPSSSARGARTARAEPLKTNMAVLRMGHKPTPAGPAEKPDKGEFIVWRYLTVRFKIPGHGPAAGHAGVRAGRRPRLVRARRLHPRHVAGHGFQLRGAARGTPRHPPAAPDHAQGLGLAAG